MSAGRRAHLVWRLRALVRPPVTLGVRCLVTDGAGRLLLLRHTYTKGWHFPGGAVDPGESARTAAVREVREETGVRLEAPPRFFGFYWNRSLAGRDHVAFYVATDVGGPDAPDLSSQAFEVAEAAWFAADALPADVSDTVRRRLAEWRGETPIAEEW